MNHRARKKNTAPFPYSKPRKAILYSQIELAYRWKRANHSRMVNYALSRKPMEEKITIIEGPSPTFELVDDGWSTGVMEGPSLYGVAVTQLRTFNGGELVERCYRAWSQKLPIHLEYRDEEGNTKNAVIVAARNTESDEGEVLMLWVRLPDAEIELAIGYEDDEGDDPGPDPEAPA
ncbi:MAG: hypothetical protein ACRDFQ_02575 [Anaerolineales bacterium]